MSGVLAFEESDLHGDYFDDDFEEHNPHFSDLPVNVPQINPALRTFYFEYSVIAFLIMYGIAFYIGKQKNGRLAAIWMHALKPIFSQNFVHVGVSDKPDGPLYQ